ncbi:MAG: hypothetical protein ACYDGY_10025 [Acidimicrobiales bacterium]
MDLKRLTVQVTIEAGEPLVGTMRVDPNEPELAFTGWFGLVEVLEVMRRRFASRSEGDEPPT